MSENPYVEEVSFETVDEMVEFMTKAKAEIDARPLHEQQLGIGWGDYGVRFYEDLIIFAHVETRESLLAEEIETREAIEERFMANTLWCKCYSRIVHDGEYGYLHRSVLWPIPARVFADAQQVGFDARQLPQLSRFQVEAAYHALRAHTGSNS